jgi:hypothetical protein
MVKFIGLLEELVSCIIGVNNRSQWPRDLRRRSTAARLLRSWNRIHPEAWMFVCCVCCVLSGRGLCDGLITRPEESYRLWRVIMCDRETCRARENNNNHRGKLVRWCFMVHESEDHKGRIKFTIFIAENFKIMISWDAT